MAEDNNTQETANAQTAGAQFNLQKIYVKDMSFEAPMGVAAFSRQWKPKINQDMNTSVSKLDEHTYEVVLKMTVTAELGEKTAFLVEVHQAGIFRVSGLDEQQLTPLLGTMCPEILFPYAREAIDSVVVKGGFPALALPPVNFDALFAQAVQSAKQKAQQEESGDTPISSKN